MKRPAHGAATPGRTPRSRLCRRPAGNHIVLRRGPWTVRGRTDAGKRDDRAAPRLRGRSRAARRARDGSVIVVSWNSARFLEGCLASLAAQRGAVMEVVVVDNGSTDGSAALARARDPRARVIELGENRGFCAANNAGPRGGHGIVRPVPQRRRGALRRLRRADASGLRRDPRIGMVAGRLLRFDRRTVDSAGQFLTRSRRVVERAYGEPDGPGLDAPGLHLLRLRSGDALPPHDDRGHRRRRAALRRDLLRVLRGPRRRLARGARRMASVVRAARRRVPLPGRDRGGGRTGAVPPSRAPAASAVAALPHHQEPLDDDPQERRARRLRARSARSSSRATWPSWSRASWPRRGSCSTWRARGPVLRGALRRRRAFLERRGVWGARRAGARGAWVRWKAPLPAAPESA
jgi:hypothetical protein